MKSLLSAVLLPKSPVTCYIKWGCAFNPEEKIKISRKPISPVEAALQADKWCQTGSFEIPPPPPPPPPGKNLVLKFDNQSAIFLQHSFAHGKLCYCI
jgi:hypothetical protein